MRKGDEDENEKSSSIHWCVFCLFVSDSMVFQVLWPCTVMQAVIKDLPDDESSPGAYSNVHVFDQEFVGSPSGEASERR